MIKDVFVLKKNSWHVKLMRWIWGYEYYEFRNMCPYFWLSVLNVIIVTPFAIFVGVKNLLISIGKQLSIPFDMYNDYCDRKHREWVDQMRLKVQKDIADGKDTEFLRRLFAMHTKDFKGGKKYRSLWYNLDYETTQTVQLKYYQKLVAQNEREKELAKEREVSRTKRIANTTMWIKKSAKFILAAIGIGVLYLLYLLVSWLITLNWLIIGKWTLLILVACVIISAALLILYGIIRLIIMLICKYAKYCIPCEERRAKIGGALRTTVSPFVWLGNGIATLWEVLKALKKDNCPGIDWEE